MIRQLIPEEFCLKCKGCCRFAQLDSSWSPSLLDDDVGVLLKHKIPPFVILPNKKIRLAWYQKEDVYTCSLLDPGDNRCRVYAWRPFECQLYPFLVNRKGKNIYLAVDEKCPFIKDLQKTQLFKAYVQYLTDCFNAPELRKILKRNPQIAQEYPGVINLISLKI